MVERELSQEAKDQLEKYSLYQALLIHIEFAGGDVFITDNHQDIVFEGNRYEAGGGFVELGSINEDSELKNSTTTLTLDGLTGTIPAILLGEDITDRPFSARRVFLDENHQVDSVFVLLDGTVAGANLDDSSGEKARIKIASHWANFSSVNGRRTNSNSQQRLFPGDTAFRFAAAGAKEVRWGRP